jgi:hypothetical protein
MRLDLAGPIMSLYNHSKDKFIITRRAFNDIVTRYWVAIFCAPLINIQAGVAVRASDLRAIFCLTKTDHIVNSFV